MLFDLSTSLVAHGSLDDTLQGVVRTVRSLFDLAGCAIVLPSGDGLRLAAVDGEVPGDLDERFVGVRDGGLDPAPGPCRGRPGAGRGPDRAHAQRRVRGRGAGGGRRRPRLLRLRRGRAARSWPPSPTGGAWPSAGCGRRSSATGPWPCRRPTGSAPPCSTRSPTTCAPRWPRSRPPPQPARPGVRWSDAERDEFLATINTEADRLTRLVHNLLDMSRIEAGALDPHLVESSVAEVVGPVVRRARAASSSGSTWTCPTSWRRCWSTRSASTRCSPACSTTPAATPPAARSRWSPARPATRSSSGWSTTGPASRPRRAGLRPVLPAQGRRQAAQGTGMGLAICQGIVRGARWQPPGRDDPGGGALSVLTLPVSPPAPAPDHEVARP